MTASINAVSDTAVPKWRASGGRVALTTLAVLALIYQRHIPESLIGAIWIKDMLDWVELTLAALLVGQLLRTSYCSVRGGVRKIREFSRVAVHFFRNSGVLKITLEVPESQTAADVGDGSGS